MKIRQRRLGLDKPAYPRPDKKTLAAATKQLEQFESFIIPGSAVLATVLIRALIHRGISAAAAQWAIQQAIESGRYRATTPADDPRPYIVTEYNIPAELELGAGVAHRDASCSSLWGEMIVSWDAEGLDSEAGEWVAQTAAMIVEDAESSDLTTRQRKNYNALRSRKKRKPNQFKLAEAYAAELMLERLNPKN